MVKKLLNMSSWDPVLTCPDEDDADCTGRRAVLAGWLQLARSQVLENGNIKNNIY
jgi:hypothetical protein